MNAHRTPLSPLRAALAGRRAKGSVAFRGIGAPSDSGRGAPSGRFRPALLATASLLALATASLLATPASALTTHVFSTSFGTPGSGDGQVSSPRGIAVNATTHDVYVADTGNARIDQFDASGTFIRAFGADVGGFGVNVCTSGCAAGTPGSGAGAFIAPTFVAVDNSGGLSNGDVYVGDTGTNLVQKFDSSGNLTAAWGSGGQLDGSLATRGPFGPLAGIAVDSSGNLWVYDQNANMFEFGQDDAFTTDWNSGRGVNPAGIGADSAGNPYVLTGGGSVEQFSSTGTDVGPVNGDVSSPTGFGIDPSSNDVYMDNGGSQIYHYAASCDAGGSCTALDTFGSGHLSAATGLAIDPSNTKVYAADTGNQRVAVFAAANLADVTTSSASAITKHSATLNGHLDPAGAGDISDCHFQYTDDATFATQGYTGASTIPCDQSTPISSPSDATASLTGLDQGTTYHFRLLATDPQGTNQGQDQTFTTVPAVALTIAAADPVGGTTATLHGHVDPSGGGDITDCHFDYTDDATFGSQGFSGARSAPCTPATPISAPTDVSADLSALDTGTTYHVRLVATNSDGTTASADQPFTTFRPPAIGFESYSAIGTTYATLEAQLNPDGTATTYHFEYGETEAYGSSTAESAPIGSDQEDHLASATISGLSSGTTYHFRVLATNSGGTIDGPDLSFTTYAPPPPQSCPNAQMRTGYSANLPDCRAYEMVSPLAKNGFYVATAGQAAASGDAVTYSSPGAFPGSAANAVTNSYLASRGAGGWSTQSLLPPQARRGSFDITMPIFPAFSADLSSAVLSDAWDSPPLVSGEQETPEGAEAANLFLRDNSTGAYSLINAPSPGVTPAPYKPTFDGASADFSTVIFNATAALTPEAPTIEPGNCTRGSGGGPPEGAGCNLYEWSHGTVSLVSQIPPAGQPSCGPGGPACVPAPEGGVFGGVDATEVVGKGTLVRAISADGSRIFFTVEGNLYMREDGERTVQVDLAQGGPGPGGGGEWATAAGDGSKVFFFDDASAGLTADTVPGSGTNLYSYDTHTGALTDLTPAAEAGVGGVVDEASEDGSYLYFAAAGVLTSVPNSLGQTASPGNCQRGAPLEKSSCNLYLAHDGTVSFIHTVRDPSQEIYSHNISFYFHKASRVTPDGRHLVFFAEDRGRDAAGEARHSELFEYSAESGRVEHLCLCNESVFPYPPYVIGFQYNRALSDDGARVFFDTVTALLPGDTNGQPDVYEYERNGAGSCHRTAGCLYLVSSGTSALPSEFVDASASGDDVFFTTHQQLAPSDTDGAPDLYDARVGGGFSAPPSPAPCLGDACQPAPTTLNDATPPTATHHGPGNERPSTSRHRKHRHRKHLHRHRHRHSRRAAR